MKTFKEIFLEMVEAGVVGTAGSGSVFTGDTYATGDARIPTSIYGGKVMRRPGMTPRKKKHRRKLKECYDLSKLKIKKSKKNKKINGAMSWAFSTPKG